MFGGSNSSQSQYIDILNTLPYYNQNDLFFKYTGIYPDTDKRYKSLLRSDKDPGCRFKWHRGLLYFIDNAGYNNRLYFNIVDIVSILKNISIKEAINLIVNDETIPNVFLNDEHKQIKERPDIKIKSEPWTINNYFGIHPYYLNQENVFKVSDYWINSNGEWKYNHIHNPKKDLTIAYYFPSTNHIKLYFPEKNVMKWYSNCDDDDIYGEYKLPYYLERDNRLIIITKSQKDRLILDYVYGYNAIAVQREGSDFERVVPYLKRFEKQLILFDNDKTGQNYASLYSNKYDIPWKNMEIGKDAYEYHKLIQNYEVNTDQTRTNLFS